MSIEPNDLDEVRTDETCPGCQRPLYRKVVVIRDYSGGVTRCEGGCDLIIDWNGDVARAVPRWRQYAHVTIA